MAQTVAYTSSAPNPKVSQVDSTKSQSLLPVANVQLYGDAVDPTDGAAVFTWKWYLLDAPPGSGCVFIDPDTDQNPKVGPIDTWGNYLFMLVATSGSAGGASEANRLKAPTTAFVQVCVQSTKNLLERPAKWSRRWALKYWGVVTALENQTIDKHADVAVATGAKLDILCGGGVAEDPPGTPLHTHSGLGLDPATDADLGVVKLMQPAVDPANPTAVNCLRDSRTVVVDGSYTRLGHAPGQIVPQATIPGTAIPTPHALIPFDDSYLLDKYTVALVDGGDTGSYGFVLYMGSAADWAAGTPTLIVASAISAAAAGNMPWIQSKSLGGGGMVGTGWLGVVCAACPAVPGSRLSVTIDAYKNL